MTVEGLTGIREVLCLLFSRKTADLHFSGITWESWEMKGFPSLIVCLNFRSPSESGSEIRSWECAAFIMLMIFSHLGQ